MQPLFATRVAPTATSSSLTAVGLRACQPELRQTLKDSPQDRYNKQRVVVRPLPALPVGQIPEYGKCIYGNLKNLVKCSP